MARASGKGYGRNNVVATGTDSGDQVSVDAWNDDKDAGGMLGFTSSTKTISSGAITPVDTVTVAAAEAGTTDDLDFITYSDTMENDVLYLFADSGDTITVRHSQSPGAGQSAIITTSAASVTLSETVPLVLQRRSTTFYQIIENSISSVTAGSTTTFTNKSIDLTDNTLTGTSAELATAISDETGSGALVFGTSPTLVTPALGTPSALVLTNATGLPLTSGVTGVLPSANLDADTAHLSTTQTFTGDKTFTPLTTHTGGIDVVGADIDNIQNLVHDLSTTTVALDFSADQLQEITVSATATFTCSAYTVGSSKTIKILDSGSGQTLAFPAGWKFVGTKPTAIAASKTGILTLTCFSTTEASVVAAYAEEA
jgi:hypothetical protein